MISLDDILAIESDDDSELDHYAALQRAINSGVAWSFQGSYGRAMMDAITEGRCCLGNSPARDYWGSYIPSRDEVQPGTKGSIDYVAHHYGEDWAEFISTL